MHTRAADSWGGQGHLSCLWGLKQDSPRQSSGTFSRNILGLLPSAQPSLSFPHYGRLLWPQGNKRPFCPHQFQSGAVDTARPLNDPAAG